MPGCADGYVIAFDFGLKHIGVAIGQSLTGTARGIATLRARQGKPDWRTLQNLVDEYRPIQAVVGLPLNMDGSESAMSLAARAFAEQVSARMHLPSTTQDERLTSKAAKEALADAKAMGKATSDHELAACLILESWFESA